MSQYGAWTLSFLAGFLLMVLELTASRLMAPIMGSSLYTWTAVIGVVLMGLTVGAYAGGVAIDKMPTLKTLGITFFSGGLSIGLLYLLTPTAFIVASLPLPIPLLATGIAALLFFIPSFLLGMIQPMIVRLSTNELRSIGKSYGLLSACWSLGSIVGVFMTGYIFIPNIGSLKTLMLVSILLVISGGSILRIVRGRGNMVESSLAVLLLFSMWVTATMYYGKNVVFAKDSAYYSIVIADTNLPNYGPSRIFFLDVDTHSVKRTNSGAPLYTDITGLLHHGLTSSSSGVSIGAGAYMIPNDLVRLASSTVLVVEIDKEVSVAAHRYFPVHPDVKTHIGDARVFFRQSNEQYDLIFGDAFSSHVAVPWHLLTKEFTLSIREHLLPRGVYAMNIISAVSGEQSELYRSVDDTLRTVFPYVEAYAFGANHEDPQNIILVAARTPLDILVEKGKITKVVPEQSTTFEDMRITTGHPRGVVLTDDFAPTEKLQAPITKSLLPTSLALYRSVLGLFDF